MSRHSIFANLALVLSMAALTASSAFCVRAVAQSSYTIVSIPAYQGYRTQPNAVSVVSGIVTVVGGSGPGVDGSVGDLVYPVVFTYNPATKQTTYAVLPDRLGDTAAESLNSSGQVVGASLRGAFLWQPDATQPGGYRQVSLYDLPISTVDAAGSPLMTNLAALGWSSIQTARINQEGDITANGSLNGAGGYALFLHAEPGGVYTVAQVGYGSPIVWAMNDDTRVYDAGGAVVSGHAPQVGVAVSDVATGTYTWSLWEWDASGGHFVRWLSAPFNQPRCLNNKGEVADWGSHGYINLPVPAYGYTPADALGGDANGATYWMGTFGGYRTNTHGLNDIGQAVGLSNQKSGGHRAFLWQGSRNRGTGNLTDLNTMLANGKNWALLQADGITNLPVAAQNYIVAHGTYKSVTAYGVLLVPNP